MSYILIIIACFLDFAQICLLKKRVEFLKKRVEFLEDTDLINAHTMGVMARIVNIIETQYKNDEELIEDLENLVKEVKYDEEDF